MATFLSSAQHDFAFLKHHAAGRYKIDNFRLYCISTDVSGIESRTSEMDSQKATETYNLMGMKVNSRRMVRGLYIRNGKKYVK